MKKLVRLRLVIVGAFLLTTANGAQNRPPQKATDLIALLKEKSGLELSLDDRGWQWKDEDIRGTPDKGEATFSDVKWLMFLIHWGPIQVPRITVDYVKRRMLKMWGVAFEFSGPQGETTIAGHPAAWAEAYGTKRSFYTRFIIWNCPPSGREFIADTNYNIRVKTPVEDFEAETKAARTILCHEGAMGEKDPDMTNTFASAKYGFSFSYPERWFIFDSPFYVPFPQYEGARDSRLGSLLGLPSDQNLTVTLKWLPLSTEKEQMTMGVDEKIQTRLAAEVQAAPGIISIRQQGFESFAVAGHKVYRIWGGYTARAPLETKGSALTVEGIFQAATWNLEEKGKTLGALLKTTNFDYQSNLSTPTRDAHDRFLRDLVTGIR